LTEQINSELGTNKTSDEVAYGFIQLANETMIRSIRTLTEAKGYDTTQHRLATFGGAGGQHAVAIAQSLGMKMILIHRYSSVLSAYGMALADVVEESQEPCSMKWRDGGVEHKVEERLKKLRERTSKALEGQGFSDDGSIVHEEYLNMRYRGTESALMIIKPKDGDFEQAFVKEHEREFGFTLPDRDIILDDVRVRGIGKTFQGLDKTVDQQLKESPTDKHNEVAKEKALNVNSIYFEGGRKETPIHKLDDLEVNDRINGPAIIVDGTQTIVVPPGSWSLILKTHVVIYVEAGKESPQKLEDKKDQEPDAVLLSIFSNRFMAIAEQMGRALQRTSVSTNVKERLDYSCALFDSTGGLVANGMC